MDFDSEFMIKMVWLSVLVLIFSLFQIGLSLILPDLPTHQIASTIDAVRRAAVPGDLETATAIGFSEAIAGAVGGLASRGAARAIGDKKIDTVQTKVAITGAFFGARGLILVICQLLGFPRTLSVPLSSIAATVISESAKAFGRYVEDVGPSEKLRFPEVVGDITKWLTYDAFEDTFLGDSGMDFVTESAYAAAFGAIAAVAGSIIHDVLSHLEEIPSPSSVQWSKLLGSRNLRQSVTHYSQVLVEGAMLFGFYKLFTSIEEKSLPNEFKKKFFFDQLLEMLEEDVSKIEDII